MALTDNIPALLEEVKKLDADSLEQLEELRIKYISKKGIIPQLITEFRSVEPERKRELGIAINELKTLAQNRINALREKLEEKLVETDKPDLTRTSYPTPLGTRHPISIVKGEIIDIFTRLGFCLADGPEIEDDWHVFSSMNFPEDHPARDMQDTFFIESHPDILLLFAQEMFGKDTKIRLRPSYFPFTEPSAEMDISCNICGGKGCAFCKNTGWVEILGCGMVDPAVLEANGIDPVKYTGYAFGMGVERITNLKYQVKDLRLFSENDKRFLEEFISAN